MRKIQILALLVAILGFLHWAWSSLTEPWGHQTVSFSRWSKSCFEGGTRIRYKSCQYVSPKGASNRVLYVLHGKDMNEQSWEDPSYYTGMMQKEWDDPAIRPPRVVTISFGKLWILSPKPDDSSGQSLYDVVVREALPQIESGLGTIEERMIMGESMGGLNALILALRSKLFTRVAALCPPIYSVSPFAPWAEKVEMVKRTGADPVTALFVFRVANSLLDNENQWKLMSPLHLLAGIETRLLPSLYVSGDLYDKYGIYEGAQAFVDQAKAKGARIEWRPIYGGHCAIDVKSLSQFLTGPRP